MNQPLYKSLDELSFSDLYIEQDGQNFPHLSEAFGRLLVKLRFRKPNLRISDEESRVGYYRLVDRFSLAPVHRLRPRH